MTGQAKVQLILELKNKMKTGLTKAKESVNRNVSDMKAKMNDLKNSHVKAFKAMRDEIPLFDKAMKLLGNPYVLIAAGAVAVTLTLVKATQAAADFNHEFLQFDNCFL